MIVGFSATDVLAATVRASGIPQEALTGPRRGAALARWRQIGFYVAYTKCGGCSLPMIGRVFGGRDHTTVLYGFRKIKTLIASGDATATERVATIEDGLQRTERPVSSEKPWSERVAAELTQGHKIREAMDGGQSKRLNK